MMPSVGIGRLSQRRSVTSGMPLKRRISLREAARVPSTFADEAHAGATAEITRQGRDAAIIIGRHTGFLGAQCLSSEMHICEGE